MQLHLSAEHVLTTTRSVRKRLDFDRPVERSAVEQCLEIALQAPTGSNSQAGLFPIAYTIGIDFRPARQLPLDTVLHWDAW